MTRSRRLPRCTRLSGLRLLRLHGFGILFKPLGQHRALQHIRGQALPHLLSEEGEELRIQFGHEITLLLTFVCLQVSVTTMQCKIPGCTDKVKARRMCVLHYHRLLCGKDLTIPRQRSKTDPTVPRRGQPCSVSGCDGISSCMGMCSMHYTRKVRGKEITLPRKRCNHPFDSSGQKRCPACKEFKPTNQYGTAKNGRVPSRCLLCSARAGRIRGKRERSDLRVETIRAYGGRCACCQEDMFEFLAMDHINGRGGNRRDRGDKLLRRLKREGYPCGYRVLCHNCNLSFGFYGYCPHNSGIPPSVSGRLDSRVTERS